jgi:hypothetical protein
MASGRLAACSTSSAYYHPKTNERHVRATVRGATQSAAGRLHVYQFAVLQERQRPLALPELP